MPRAGDEIILTTCPRDCYDSCGISVIRRSGRVHHIRGNPAHPVSRGALCGKCSTAYNREWLDPQVRLTTPLKRVGAKGEARFTPVTWDEAISEIASRLAETVNRHGAERILNAHYTGTISLLAGNAPMRFFNRLGATEVAPDTICNMAGHVALRYVFGTSVDGFDPRTAKDAACIVVWGANPSASAPHAHDHWLPEAPGTTVIVDPIRTATADSADIHLQPFPGSDAALAFALLHVIERDGLVAQEFLDRNAVGWDELRALLPPCTPQWGEEVSGVPARLIVEVAHRYAQGPSLLWLGQGLQRQPTGGNVMRALAALPVVTGNLAKAGAGILYLNGNAAVRGIDESFVTGAHLARSPPPPLSHMDLPGILEDPGRARALIVWNMNPAGSSPNQARLRRALSREDLFTVVVDLFATDTTAYADFVLPAASFLEFDDLVLSYFELTVSAQQKVMEPLGEALPNTEIFRRIARAMGFTEPEFLETDAQIIARVLAGGVLGETFASLAAKGSVWSPATPVIQFSDMKFATPSGRIELASDQAQADGYPRVPQPWADRRPDSGRLRLLSPAHTWLLNTSFGNVSRVTTRIGPATLVLHPRDAQIRALAAGDRVVAKNATGSLELIVAISDEVPQGVALSHKGRWLSAEPAGANVNVLNPGTKSDMGESTAVHSVEIELSPAVRVSHAAR
jgi:anaerobic selenocysteine-containing dehydrogenase